MLQSYKDETMSIELVKSEIASLFEGHPTLLDQFSFFLPTPAPENKLKKKERKKHTLKVKDDPEGGGVTPSGKYKTKKALLAKGGAVVVVEEEEEEFVPTAGDRDGTLVFEIIELLREAGGSRYSDFLKAMKLLTVGVINADDFALLIHDLMMSGPEIKRWSLLT